MLTVTSQNQYSEAVAGIGFPPLSPVCLRIYDTLNAIATTVSVWAMPIDSPTRGAFPTGTRLHPAYHIILETSDVPTLSPAPPNVPDGCTIPVL